MIIKNRCKIIYICISVHSVLLCQQNRHCVRFQRARQTGRKQRRPRLKQTRKWNSHRHRIAASGGYKRKKRPEGALSTLANGLFGQFSGHVHAVTGVSLGNFVRAGARLFSLSGNFRFCTVNSRGGCGHCLCSERTKRSGQSHNCDKSFDAFHDINPLI